MAEKWLPIKDFEGLYEVSSIGRVKSLPRNTTSGKIISQQLNRKGYPKVWLSKTKKFTFAVHRLVAFAFIKKTKERNFVDHIDHDIKNNHVSNLRWCTHSENLQNQTKRKNTSSKYKGVSWNTKDKAWVVVLYYQRRHVNIGRFKDERVAALAYNKRAKEIFGQFANINII